MVTPIRKAADRLDQCEGSKARPAPGFSMADLFEIVTPHLSRELAPAEALSRIRAVSSLFPPLSGTILECQLDAGCSSLDLSLRATTSDGGREFLAGFHPARRFPDAFVGEPGWQRISAFCVEWMNSDSPIHHRVENIWLEFDLDAQPAKAPLPCVFFDRNSDDPTDNEWIGKCALPILLGAAVSPSANRNLHRCLLLLRRFAKIHYVGAMLGRRADAIRLNLKVETERVFDCLASMGLEGSVDEIRSIVNLAERFSSMVTLNFDVGESIQSKVGIEIKPDSRSDWPLLLDKMVVEKLFAQSKRDALLAWPGCSDGLAPTNNQPGIPLIALSSPPPPAAVLAARRLNHIKIVYHPAGPLEPKAYLYAGFGLHRSKLHRTQARDATNSTDTLDITDNAKCRQSP